MNLLDRHIFKNVLFACAGAVALFVFVLTLGNVIKDLLGPTLAGQIPLLDFFRLVWFWVPAMAIYALPIGILTGVLLTLGRLSADSEITAMRAAGLSVLRIARPVMILGALGAAWALYINFVSMPHARQTYEKDFAAMIRNNPLSFIVPQTYIRDFRGHVLYVGEQQGSVLRDIWIWELDAAQRVRRIVRADSGRLVFDEATNSLIPTLVHAKIEERNPDDPQDFSKSPRAPSVEKADEVRLPVDRFFNRSTVRVKPEWRTFSELRAEQARLEAEPLSSDRALAKRQRIARMNLAIVLHEKINLACAVLAFALLAVPLGIKISRRETSANLGLALALVLGHYVLTVMIKWLQGHPEYHPDLLLWLPNLLFVALAVRLFRRIGRA